MCDTAGDMPIPTSSGLPIAELAKQFRLGQGHSSMLSIQ